MRTVILLFTTFYGFLFLSEIYAQEKILKDGFYIQANPERKEIYFIDINELQCRKSPRYFNNNPVGSIRGIDLQFQQERPEMEKNIFSENEITQLKKYRIVATIYINSKTNKIESVSFRFRDMIMNDIDGVDIKKFAEYREMLKKQLLIRKIFYDREIKEHGYISQSFRVFYEKQS